jgi:hypothetical protein
MSYNATLACVYNTFGQPACNHLTGSVLATYAALTERPTPAAPWRGSAQGMLAECEGLSARPRRPARWPGWRGARVPGDPSPPSGRSSRSAPVARMRVAVKGKRRGCGPARGTLTRAPAGLGAREPAMIYTQETYASGSAGMLS